MSNRFIDTKEDSISKYLKEVRKHPILTKEEELVVTTKVKEGDEKAIDQLVKSNLRFVISIAKEYQNQGLSLADLISEGNIGLIKAANKFEPERGFKFISYAVWWIKQSILQSLNENSRTVRLPVNKINEISQVRKEIAKFEQMNERLPSSLEVKNTQYPSTVSLNATINDEGDELLNVIEDTSVVAPDQNVLTDDILKDEIDKTLRILSDRERLIIESWFGLKGQQMTLEQIGNSLPTPITKERVRQIKERAIRQIKNSCDGLYNLLNHM